MPTPTVTDEDLLRLPRDGRKYEFVDGEVRVSPAGGRHGEVSGYLVALLVTFVKPRKLGKVFDSSTGFRMSKGNLRAPDASFVAADRLPDGKAPTGFFEIRPDLAVEVLSPTDDAREVLDRVGEYLAGGTRMMWVIDPQARRAAVYRSLTDVRQIEEDGVLDGEEVVPGFRCHLSEVLE